MKKQLFLFLLMFAALAHAQRPRPNVVVIMADDLDSRQLSCYGGKNMRTPNIDALAAQGMKFNQIVASEAMCVPTRASLFTGLYPVRHGSFQNHKPVYNNLKSICHYLGDLGYDVALTGKDHSTKPAQVFPFRFVTGFEPNCVAKTDDYSLDGVKQYVRSQKKPFCLFVMSINPHAPWTVGDPSEFDPVKLVLPPHWVDTKDIRELFAKYLAEVRRLDQQVGEVMKTLKETGQDKNTIVIFLGEQGAQFPGAKWNLWDAGQKSSMIVRWPGNIQPKTETEALVQYEDITPTLVELAGGKAVAGMDGKSFANVLKGQADAARPFAFGIHNNIPEGPPYPMRSVRTANYKLIWNLSPGKKNHIKYMMNPNNKDSYWNHWKEIAATDDAAKRLVTRVTDRPEYEFYDLKKDPYELNNLAADPARQQVISKYKKALQGWMDQQQDKGAALDIVYEKESH
ncbi:heparan N-sulfatase [Pedobacter yulinensis]|uniref:Heparan N-sulfatase n=1 Tax=Pedobacter yulinensis TaxID=2126353 RepID=A0A2T3HK78_9SPHI|nr:sulfatase [Pedobacter yulinensis]PST82868.1 heparan N-sulfatase [Pedobacter yulinensis]